MKVGITGAAGFLGSHLCDRLLREGMDVVGVDDLSRGTMVNLSEALSDARFRFERLDCTRRRDLRAAFDGCDSIVHLAAQKIPRYGGALKTLEANVAGVNAAARTALAMDADLILASTSDVYGNGEPPFAEDDKLVLGPPTTRRWAYAVSKLYDEHVCLALAEELNLKVTILRFFGSYGPRNHPSWWGGPQAAFFEALLDGQTIEIHGDGQQTRTFTYVDDTVEGIYRSIITPEARGEVLNIGANTPTTIYDLAVLVQKTLGIRLPLRARIVPYDELPGRYRTSAPSRTHQGQAVLGFEAKRKLAEGLERTAQRHQARRLERQWRHEANPDHPRGHPRNRNSRRRLDRPLRRPRRADCSCRRNGHGRRGLGAARLAAGGRRFGLHRLPWHERNEHHDDGDACGWRDGNLLHRHDRDQRHHVLLRRWSVASGAESSNSLVVQAKPVARTCVATNPTVQENCHAGDAGWRVTDPGNVSSGGIEGYAAVQSLNKGESVNLMVNSGTAPSFQVQIYRSGYYGGAGARLFSIIRNVPGTSQPA